MTAVGGPIESVSLKGRNFAVAADADAARKLGGFEKEVQMNGDSTSRIIMSRVGWSIGGLSLSVDDVRGDQEFLQDVCDSPESVAIAVTFCSGSTYSGTGTITGELSFSSQNSTAEVSLGGGGRLTKI